MDRDPMTEKIIGCAIEVHRALGPGLLTHMKLARIHIGLLLNFNQQRLIEGLRRFELWSFAHSTLCPLCSLWSFRSDC